MIDVAVSIDACWSDGEDWERLLAGAVVATFEASPCHAWLAVPQTAEIAVRLTNDAEVQALNATWRGKDKPTNVLSFPQFDRDEILAAANEAEAETLLGDIVMAWETCTREAKEKSIDVSSHAIHLVVHGTLHLLGFDHQTDVEADEMERLEKTVMASLGLADPYALEGAH